VLSDVLLVAATWVMLLVVELRGGISMAHNGSRSLDIMWSVLSCATSTSLANTRIRLHLYTPRGDIADSKPRSR
jgi:hypothetical protein